MRLREVINILIWFLRQMFSDSKIEIKFHRGNNYSSRLFRNDLRLFIGCSQYRPYWYNRQKRMMDAIDI